MRYPSKAALLDDVRATRAELVSLLRGIPKRTWREMKIWGDDWDLADLLAHLAEWQRMFLTWHREGTRGEQPAMPAPGYKWNETPKLNHAIRERHRARSCVAIERDFTLRFAEVIALAESLTEAELLKPGRFAWTGKHSIAAYLGPNSASHDRFAIRAIGKWRKQMDKTRPVPRNRSPRQKRSPKRG